MYFLSSCYTVINKHKTNDIVHDDIYNNSQYDSLNTIIDSSMSDTVITLERTGCHGRCPIFKIILLSNGTTYFEGKLFVEKIGLFDTKYNKNDLDKLLLEIYGSGFLELQDSYDMKNCNGYFDLPGLAISIKTNEISKKVYYYFGCIGYEEEEKIMSNLAKKIENISNVEDWIE